MDQSRGESMRIKERYELADGLEASPGDFEGQARNKVLDAFCLGSGDGRKPTLRPTRSRMRLPCADDATIISLITFRTYRYSQLLDRARSASVVPPDASLWTQGKGPCWGTSSEGTLRKDVRFRLRDTRQSP